MTAQDDRKADLRAMVRAALRDALPEIAGHAAGPVGAAGEEMARRISAAAQAGGGTITVRIDNDDDLLAFAAMFITCGDPLAQAAVMQGKVRLQLDRGAPALATPRPAAPAETAIAAGVVGERQVVEIAKTHRVLLVAKDVVVTPLARDRARACGLEIVRKAP